MKDHLIPRRMQLTVSRCLFSFQSYKCLNIANQRDIEKGLGTRICDVIRLESQLCEKLNDLFLICCRSDLIEILHMDSPAKKVS